MARFNEILVGRFNRALQKLFAIKGGPPSAQLATEITPNIQMFYGVENRYIESWQRFGNSTSTGAPLAGNRAAWRIRNPAGSNVVAVLEKISLFESNGADSPFMFYNSIATVLPTENQSNISGTNMDSRGQQLGSTAIISTSINFGLLGSGPIWQENIPLNTNVEVIFFEDQEISLPPGSELTIASNGVGVAEGFVVSVWWRERFLEDSERT